MSHDSNSCDCGCEDVYRTLFELLDGNLSLEKQEKLHAKVAACPECFAKLGIEQEVRQLLRRCCCASAPMELRERITISLQVKYKYL